MYGQESVLNTNVVSWRCATNRLSKRESSQSGGKVWVFHTFLYVVLSFCEFIGEENKRINKAGGSGHRRGGWTPMSWMDELTKKGAISWERWQQQEKRIPRPRCLSPPACYSSAALPRSLAITLAVDGGVVVFCCPLTPLTDINLPS